MKIKAFNINKTSNESSDKSEEKESKGYEKVSKGYFDDYDEELTPADEPAYTYNDSWSRAGTSTYTSIDLGSTFAPVSEGKKSFKLPKDEKMKDPYLSIIQNEYQTLLSEVEKFGIPISEERKAKIKSNIDVLNEFDLNLKKLLEESNKKQQESKKELDSLKQEVAEVLNLKKYEDCMDRAKKFIADKSWQNAKSCYDNAMYYTVSKRNEVKEKLMELANIQSKEYIKGFINEVTYYLAQPNNAVMNRIIDKMYSIDLGLLVGEDLEVFKRVYQSIPNQKKVNLISAILENKTFKPDIKLGIL